MIDINFILNGTRKKVKPKKSRDPLMDLMSLPSGIIGDRVTKKQRAVFKQAKKQKSFMPMFGDWDGDKVINGLDCQPRNKKKHMTKVNLKEYDKPEHASQFGYKPGHTIVHGTSYKNALAIDKSKEFRDGTFVYPGRGGFEDARNWSKNKYGDQGVVMIGEVDSEKPIHRNDSNFWSGSWGTVGNRAREREGIDRTYKDPIKLRKVKILRIEGDELSDEYDTFDPNITSQTEQSHYNDKVMINKYRTPGGKLDITEYEDGEGAVSELYVDEEQRKKGIATKLLNEAKNKYRNIHAQVSNEPSVKTHYRAGFRLDDNEESDENQSIEYFKKKETGPGSIGMHYKKRG